MSSRGRSLSPPRAEVTLGIFGACLALCCASNDAAKGGGTSTGGSSSGGASGTSGQAGSAGASTGGASTGGSAGASSGGSPGGSAGTTGTGGAGAGGAAGSVSSGAGGVDSGGAAGVAGSSVAGSTSGGSSSGGASGSGGAAGSSGGGGKGGATACVGRALSLASNGTASASDAAQARVEIDMGSDLPLANAQRTFEFWSFIKTSDWVGDTNELFYYGTSGTAASFGMDFGTNPVNGSTTNHATLDPFTGGGFNDDSTNDLGITSSTDQWVHIAMVWNASMLVTYVNGLPKIMTSGTGVTALATAPSVLTIGCNPSNSRCFNGYLDELRVWNVARSASEVLANHAKALVGNEPGLVGYWKFDEASGTTTADAVIAGGHTAHAGTLRADTMAHNPTFVTPAVPLTLACP